MQNAILDFDVFESEVSKYEGVSNMDERQELFQEIITSSVISVSELSKRGITPELLLDIAHNTELYYDTLEDGLKIYDELKESISNYTNIIQRRRLF